jgi:(2Fe-2S) ferredoxin
LITKRQVLGQVVLCKGCCCGRTDRGLPEVPAERIKEIWQREKLNRSIQLTVSGCLGPCDVPNVVLLIAPEGTAWFGRIVGDVAYDRLIQWARDCHAAETLLPLPDSLAENRLRRFATEDCEPANSPEAFGPGQQSAVSHWKPGSALAK